ncbi:MAG: pitrilysin family protein [Candidatus Paceibacterota bacterium]|jgi:predicted Zn-dependent peptidase
MKYTKTVLPSGLRIVTVPMKGNPTATVLVLVETGSEYEKREENGLSHFLEHMCFKGTKKRPSVRDITTELDSIGAIYNAFTSNEYTGYYAKASADKLDTILDVVSDIYLDPQVPATELERERGVIIEEINMVEDDPQNKIHYDFMSLVYGDQPAGWPILGPKENIRRFTRDDFISYISRHYVASATVVTVAGDFDEKEVIAKVEKTFAAISSGEKQGKEKVADAQSGARLKVFEKPLDQAHMMLGVRSVDVYSDHVPALSVLRAVLSGGMSARLWHKMREELGICYYIRASNDFYTDHGLFVVSAGVDKARVDVAIREICAELVRLKAELVDDKELLKAKDSIIGKMYLGLEASDDLAQFYASQEVNREKIRTPLDTEREIRAVTAEDVRKMAQMIFVDKNLSCAIVGPFADDSAFRAALTLGA